MGKVQEAAHQCWFDKINKDLENQGTTRIEDVDDWGV